MLGLFFPLSFSFFFPLSPLPGVQPGSIFLFFFFSLFFFCLIFDAMFSRYDIIPPSHASTVEAGVFCCGLGFGGVFDPSSSDLGVTLSSSRIPLEFAEGSSPCFPGFFFFFLFLFFCTIQYLALRDARNVPTSQDACFWKWSRPLWDLLYSFQHIISLGAIARRFFFPGISGRIACLVGVETSLLSFCFAFFFSSLFLLMMNVCPLGSDDPYPFSLSVIFSASLVSLVEYLGSISV